jgi:hypothetical protein
MQDAVVVLDLEGPRLFQLAADVDQRGDHAGSDLRLRARKKAVL